MMKTIFLCGFMGCGKSSLGRQLAKRLGCPFIDLDRYIVEKQGKTIPEIFAERGEDFFRELETAALRNFSEQGGKVVATGGGALIRPENAQLCRKNGIVLFIDVDFEVCYARIQGDKNRPLAAKPKEELRKLFRTRRKIYKAHSDKTIRNVFFRETIEKILLYLRTETK